MPKWQGKWKGGRYYLDEQGRPVFFIESNRPGIQRAVRLATHDSDLAVGELARYRQDPITFCRPPPAAADTSVVAITQDRLTLYMESLRRAVVDHRKAKRAQLTDWADVLADLRIDLRNADKNQLRIALGRFDGGHRGRTEALNAFCNWLVEQGDLPKWTRLRNHIDPKATRAERVAYSLDELRERYVDLRERSAKGAEQGTKVKGACHPRTADVFRLRAATGLHQTEVDQLEGARIFHGPLPDKGSGIRILKGDHEIRGVLQVMHKSRHRHRQSVDAAGLAAALRLRDAIPSRVALLESFDPIVPSNLRHTFVTLAGELGREVKYDGTGVERSKIAQVVGHRAGSTMTSDRYDKLQIPPMIALPIEDWDIVDVKPS